MKTIILLVELFVLCCAFNGAFCLTNFEFYELVKPYARDIKEYDLDDPIGKLNHADVIELPGNHDDDVDWVHLISKLDLDSSTDVQHEKTRSNSDLSWWRRRRRRRRNPVRAHCKCSGHSCNCCVSKRFSANLIFKKVSFNLRGCLNIAFLSKLKGFRVSLSANGRTLYKKEMSLKKGITICRGVPKLKVIRADVCLVFYNINLAKKRICAKLTGNLDLKIKKFGVSLPLACPIPLPFAGESVESGIDNSSITVYHGVDEDQQALAVADLPALIKELQILLEDKDIRDFVNEEIQTYLNSGEYQYDDYYKYDDEYEESYDQHRAYMYDETAENYEY